MFATGYLHKLPKRRGDLELLLGLTTLQFQRQHEYSENEVNEILQSWLALLSFRAATDHVTLRRHLVDLDYLKRDAPGNRYFANYGNLADVPDIDLLAYVNEIRDERRRKRRANRP